MKKMHYGSHRKGKPATESPTERGNMKAAAKAKGGTSQRSKAKCGPYAPR